MRPSTGTISETKHQNEVTTDWLGVHESEAINPHREEEVHTSSYA